MSRSRPVHHANAAPASGTAGAPGTSNGVPQSGTEPLGPGVLAALTNLRPALQGYALAITADHQLAEDAYQEVAALVSARPGALPAGTGALPWLREAIRRKSLELARQKRRGGSLLSEQTAQSLAAAFDGDRDTAELAARLARCVDQLASEHRAILRDHYHENLPAEEISRRVGRSVQGVYGVLKRVRRALGHCMRRTSSPGGEPWKEAMS